MKSEEITETGTRPARPGFPGSLPGIFDKTLLSGPRRVVASSIFIKAMHPKTEISPSRPSIEKILRAGWAGQMKIHGHRTQIHLPSNLKKPPIAYNRQGRPHKKILPEEIIRELRRLFKVENDWTIIDAEWIKTEDKLYIFDLLKLNGKLLRGLSYQERYQLLPKLYLSPHIQTLPLLTTVEKCLEILARPEKHIEGLVFKALHSPGFEDTSIIRCRKRL